MCHNVKIVSFWVAAELGFCGTDYNYLAIPQINISDIP